MFKIKLMHPNEVAQNANNIDYKFSQKERKNGFFFILTKQIKAVLLIFRL